MQRITKITRQLRNNLTDAEKYLWYSLRLKNLGYKFRRQALIGKYIVDFVCFDKKVVSVLQKIIEALASPSLNPSPQGGGK